MIIDIHTHIFPDTMAAAVTTKLSEEAGIRAALDGRLTSLLESMDEAHIDISCIQPVATKPSQVDIINRHMESIRSDRIMPFGAVHPDYPDLAGLIHDLAHQGFPGIKIHPEYHKCPPGDPRFIPLYEAIQEEKMLILFHAGVDIGIPTLNSTPKDFLHLRGKFPCLRMILAHMGGFQQWDAVETDLAGENFYLDTSYVFGHISDEQFLTLVQKQGANRILFGTDSPWAPQQADIRHLRSLVLTEPEQNAILGENALRLLNRA